MRGRSARAGRAPRFRPRSIAWRCGSSAMPRSGEAGVPPRCAGRTRRAGCPAGWITLHATWHERVMTEWWSLGSATVPLQQVVSRRRPERHHVVYAGSRPQLSGGSVSLAGHRPHPVRGHAADRRRRPDRRGFRSRRAPVAPASDPGGRFPPLLSLHLAGRRPGLLRARVDPARRHTDSPVGQGRDAESRSATSRPTPGWPIRLCFRWNGRYWLACTDLDLGGHDNLCLLHLRT